MTLDPNAPEVAVRRVLEAAEASADALFGDHLRLALQGLFELTPEARDAAISEIAAGIPGLESPTGAGLLAVWFGAAVEGGFDPGRTTAILLDTFLDWSRRIEPPPSGEPLRFVDQNLSDGLQLLGQGLVAHLANAPELRRRYAGDPAVVAALERVEPASIGAVWILELLRRSSGELLVLHATERIGVRVQYTEIANCFHLFTLLQGVLAGGMPGAGTPAAEVLAVAAGRAEGPVEDAAWWHYGQGTSPEPNVGDMVFGEGSPDEIATIDGEHVLLLWPPLLEDRRWDSGFFGPPLAGSEPSVTVIAELSPVELHVWWTRLGLPET